MRLRPRDYAMAAAVALVMLAGGISLTAALICAVRSLA